MPDKTKDQRILEVADQVFSQKGYTEATLDEIIKIADTGKGTVYKYFKNKENLFYTVVNGKNKPFVEKLKKAVDENDNFEDKLRSYIYVLIEFLKKNIVLWQVVMFELLGSSKGWNVIRLENGTYDVVARWGAAPTEEEKEIVIKYFSVLLSEINILEGILKEAVEKGIIKDIGDEKAFTLWASHLFGGISMTVFHSTEVHVDGQKIARLITERFMHGHAK